MCDSYFNIVRFLKNVNLPNSILAICLILILVHMCLTVRKLTPIHTITPIDVPLS